METIKLKNKKFKLKLPKKKTLLLMLIPSIVLIMIVLFKLLFQCGYQYYEIEENQEKISIGFSTNKNLIDETLYEYTKEIKDKGYIITEFNLKKCYSKRFTIRFKKDTNDNGVKEIIKKGTLILVDAKSITVDNDIIYVGLDQWKDVSKKFEKIETKVDNVSVDILKLWSTEEINDYFKK